MVYHRYRTALMVWMAVLLQPAMVWGEYPVAGVAPDTRPEGAPVITDVVRDDAWFLQAVHGLSEPYPYSLRFLEDQGNWYTPFNHPGMLGRYDLRHWHSASQ